MKNHFLLIAWIASMMVVFSCRKDISSLVKDPSAFYDQYGRAIILHGASLYTNDDPGGYQRYTANSAERLINNWGLNSVRLFWNWYAIEPDSAVFSAAKLDSLIKVVETFTNQQVYVVLAVNGTATSSQDKLQGTWMRPTGNVAEVPSLPGNANPASQEASRRWWAYKQYPYLQDEFIKASQYIATRLRNNPYVLGYDIINEPWGDGVVSTVLNSNLETQLLPDFYARYIRAMRNVEIDKYIFFEPGVLFNSRELAQFQTKLPVITDARNGDKRLCFAPHCYLLDIGLGGGPLTNSIKNNYDGYLKDLTSKYRAIQQKQQVPIYIGEWANIDYSNFDDWKNYLNKHMDAFDSVQISWSYFSYIPGGNNLTQSDDMTENPTVDIVTRAYPRAVAGLLDKFKYNPQTKELYVHFRSNASITRPTEIFIPQRHYPAGYNLSVTGTTRYNTNFDVARNILEFSTTDNLKDIAITITPK